MLVKKHCRCRKQKNPSFSKKCLDSVTSRNTKWTTETPQRRPSVMTPKRATMQGSAKKTGPCIWCRVFKIKVTEAFFNQTINDGVAHSKNPRKCAYHVTFDLYLEHTLDARWPGVHRVKVWWRSGHLCARRSNLRKSLQTTDASPLH